MVLLLFGRSCVMVGHHRLTDELFPAPAIFSSPHCDVFNNLYPLFDVVYVLFSWPPASSPSFHVPFYYCFRYTAAVIYAMVSKVCKFALANVPK